jgi:uncharacterized protein (TIGR02145 family)
MKNYNLIFMLFLLTTILFSSSGYAQTVTIGNQVWTSTNLNVSTYRNGDLIPQVQDPYVWADLTTGAWCYYKNDASNGTKYGKLYNWYAVNDPRGLAPKGYHIPTDAEWTMLTDYLGGENKAGIKMKSVRGWKSYDIGKGTNSSGFSGLPGGYRTSSIGSSDDGGYYGHWWSSSEEDTRYAWSRRLNYHDGDVVQKNYSKQCGYSVRCLRD